MSIDVTKENVCINKIVGQKNEIIVVEGDMIVPDIKPDILNTINTNGIVCVYKKEVLEGKVRIDGDVNVYVMYMADDENETVRSINSTIDFTQIIDFDGCTTLMGLDDDIKIKNIECKILNGRKINIKVTLQVDLRMYSNENIDVIKQINNLKDLQTLESEFNINTLIGEGNSKAYAKDTITIDNVDNLAEILNTDIEIVNRDIKISYNKILAKADMSVKILYLTEDSRIKIIESKIPVVGFVDVDNVKEDNICDMKYKLKNIIIKPNQVEEHSIFVEAEVELYCRVYENKEIKVIEDMYSPTENLCFNQKEVNTMSQKRRIKDMCAINENISIPELRGKEMYNVDVKPVILSQNIINEKIMYEGKTKLNFVFASENSCGINTKKCNIPFQFEMRCEDVNQNSYICTNLEVVNQDFIVADNDSVNVKIDIQFDIDISKMVTLNIIDEINIEETREREIYSMIIYFVKPGDTLWKIAKRFNSTIQDIIRVNNIEDKNKIFVGQQLFIPKYVYKEMSA